MLSRPSKKRPVALDQVKLIETNRVHLMLAALLINYLTRHN